MTCPTCHGPLSCAKCTRSAQIRAGMARGKKRKSKHTAIARKLLKLHAKGMSFAEIARLTGVPRSTAHRIATQGEQTR